MDVNGLIITKRCVNCGKSFEIVLKDQAEVDAYQSWLRGEGHIQDLLPRLTPSERELLISGFCGDCYNALFADDEDEE